MDNLELSGSVVGVMQGEKTGHDLFMNDVSEMFPLRKKKKKPLKFINGRD